MEDAFAVLCCLIGLAVFRVCWHVIVHRKRQIPLEPDEATPPGSRSLLSFLLDMLPWKPAMRPNQSGGFSPQWFLPLLAQYFSLAGYTLGSTKHVWRITEALENCAYKNYSQASHLP